MSSAPPPRTCSGERRRGDDSVAHVSGKAPRAELIEDGGEAASAEEFFRSRPFLAAEGVTHTLRIVSEAGELLAPLIVREIERSNDRDAISPYGYPGIVEGSPFTLDPESIDFSATGLVTVFLRHMLDEPPLRGASERNVVQIADPALPTKSRGSDRNQINKNLRRGYELSLVPGPETSGAERAGFLAAYEQTMRRTGASERYFFAAEYFERILEFPRTWLATARAPEDGAVAAASIAAVSDGYLHYYLSGSADSHLHDSPMKNVVASLVELSAELQLPLNLGGGIARGDRLEEFKRGFANRELPWRTSEIVADRAAYARLSGDRDAGDFFPAYRA
jgi:Acetyltransferase (GNAT) domain